MAYQSLKFKDFPDTKKNKFEMGLMLMKIAALAGIKNPTDNFIIDDIVKMIYSEFKALSPIEIYKAFELERYSKYDDVTANFQLFSTEYVSKILRKYLDWRQKRKIELSYKTPENENLKLPELTETQKREFMTGAVMKAFNFYIENGHLSDDAHTHVFQELCLRGFINNKSDRPEIVAFYLNHSNRAETELKNEYKSGLATSRRDDIKNKIKELEQGINGALTVRIYRNVLSEFFEKYKNDEFVLANIKSHKNKIKRK